MVIKLDIGVKYLEFFILKMNGKSGILIKIKFTMYIHKNIKID